jgi:hypothetical protein
VFYFEWAILTSNALNSHYFLPDVVCAFPTHRLQGVLWDLPPNASEVVCGVTSSGRPPKLLQYPRSYPNWRALILRCLQERGRAKRKPLLKVCVPFRQRRDSHSSRSSSSKCGGNGDGGATQTPSNTLLKSTTNNTHNKSSSVQTGKRSIGVE